MTITGDDTNPVTSSVFDDLTVGTPIAGAAPGRPAVEASAGREATGRAGPNNPSSGAGSGAEPVATPAGVKQAAQELLRLGVLYGETKPNLFQVILANRDLMAGILEPLDFTLRIDEVRAMAILEVAPALKIAADGEPLGDDWNHPLVRRQRLTLAQSLLVAILRRRYVEHEKTSSGTTPARVPVDEIIPELGTYLGDEGSDSANESRVRRLLEQLRDHGLVSAVDDDDQITIRPLICHVADPTSLQLLLAHYTRVARGGADPDDEPRPDGDDQARSDQADHDEATVGTDHDGGTRP